jgi:hypothetical protein
MPAGIGPSLSRQIAFLKPLRRMENFGNTQVFRLMAYGLPTWRAIGGTEMDHSLMREFCSEPSTFIDNVLVD